MKRRTLLERFGAVGVAAVGFSGTALASTGSGLVPDRGLDVSDVSGSVPLVEVLADEDLDELPAAIDPEEVQLWIDESADEVTARECCMINVCCPSGGHCPCVCCLCIPCAPN